MARPKFLKYKGGTTTNELGAKVPDRSFPGIPARDLSEKDLRRLDAETLKGITADPGDGFGPVYVRDEDEEKKIEEREEAAKKKAEEEKQAEASKQAEEEKRVAAEKQAATSAEGTGQESARGSSKGSGKDK